MAEIDQTIEELEQEVLAELEEANGADAPKKSAVAAEKMDKVEGEVQDTGKAVVEPDQKDAPAKKVAAKAKEISGDKAQKGEGKPDKMDKLAAGDQIDHEGEKLEEKSEKLEEKRMTKAEMAMEMKKQLDSMKMDELKAAYDVMMNAKDDEEMDESDKAKSEAVDKRVKEIDVKEHVDALMKGEGDLSEEFK